MTAGAAGATGPLRYGPQAPQGRKGGPARFKASQRPPAISHQHRGAYAKMLVACGRVTVTVRWARAKRGKTRGVRCAREAGAGGDEDPGFSTSVSQRHQATGRPRKPERTTGGASSRG